MIDIQDIRDSFPCFRRKDFPVYLDSAATTQKPECVLQALTDYYTASCSNIHRGNYRLSRSADDAYFAARRKINRYLNGEHGYTIFTKGVTEAIHMVAFGFCAPRLSPGKNVIVTATEHHSNYLPWQAVCQQTGAEFRVASINSEGQLNLEEYEKLIDSNTELVAFPSIANSTGIALPIERMIRVAHEDNVPVLIDAAQSVAHTKHDLLTLDCEFFCFSGHKLYGPTGIGVLWGKKDFLERMEPYQYGGGMIDQLGATFWQNAYQDLPERLEAGTPPIAGAIGLAAATGYLESIGLNKVQSHEQTLTRLTTASVSAIPGAKVIGSPHHAVVAITLDGASPYDLGVYLDMKNIAVRCGSHCSQPTMSALGISGTIRVSFGIYNTQAEAEKFCHELACFARKYCKG